MRASSASILHVDLDAFYVAVERVLDPRLRGQPVVVGGSADSRGVVAAASYEVRAFGVHSAMSMAEALRRCPELVRVPGSYAMYTRASRAVFRMLQAFTPVVERVSIDEAYLDLKGTERLSGTAWEAAVRMQREVREQLQLDLTIGLACNRLVSKVASTFAKPRGLFEVRPGQEARFLAPLDVGALPGIGPVTRGRLQEFGIERLGDLAASDPRWLQRVFGVHGPHMRRRARGEDATEVCPPWASARNKSVGHEETFVRDLREPRLLRAKLQQLLEAATRRLRRQGLLARKLTVKLRHADFSTHTRDVTLPQATDHDAEWLGPAHDLLEALLADRPAVRLLGVRLGGLQNGYWQAPLLERRPARTRKLISALDRLRAKYGTEHVRTGATVWMPNRRPASDPHEEVRTPFPFSDARGGESWTRS